MVKAPPVGGIFHGDRQVGADVAFLDDCNIHLLIRSTVVFIIFRRCHDHNAGSSRCILWYGDGAIGHGLWLSVLTNLIGDHRFWNIV